MDTSEKNFEAAIEAALLRDPLSSGSKDVPPLADAVTGAYLSGGYHPREPTDYDKELCLIPKDVVGFISATQPKEWQKMLARLRLAKPRRSQAGGFGAGGLPNCPDFAPPGRRPPSSR